ncbi:D-alanyl-D-alanine carboxypeptidase/D-alanyl-D-alanine-endopeptidase [uncultured Shewanella sp.]|uniref:D-alanyl-D-alanine carboxypeptidase/D-alanyl-D-alanine endopeptidase n=1 Tax=uncultured Shewanella sp. TaxID=173975 RepID=UPI0026125011|nr:D-alanyl-D-alanine carboxypeptidase/D-alanyl-D-alanine-endopeptidase [uncultured Shewanella sp.]
MLKKIRDLRFNLGNKILLSVIFSLPCVADESLAEKIHSILPLGSQTALFIQDITNQDQTGYSPVLFEHNAQKHFLPASTMKLLTAVAATSSLREDFTFKTRIYSDAPIINGTLNGNLFITFDGDPSLTRQDLYTLLDSLKKRGLNTIKGHFYLQSKDEEKWRAPGWSWEDLSLCYAAPVSQFAIDQNCIKAQLLPSQTIASTQLHFERPSPVHIINSAIFSPDDTCDLELVALPENQFHITGCFSQPSGIKLQIAVSNPQTYAQQTLKQIMTALGIQLTGQFIQQTQTTHNLHLLSTHSSKPLHQLIETMLVDSNNFIADSLVKKMGQKNNQQGSFKQGIAALKDELTFLGIDVTNTTITDGSGLSRYSLLTASQLASILKLIATDSRFKDLMQALPISGEKGTLKQRLGFHSTKLKGRIIAKTGTLQGVNNLAGFIKTQSGKTLLFVSLENGIIPSSQEDKPMPFNVTLSNLLVRQ